MGDNYLFCVCVCVFSRLFSLLLATPITVKRIPLLNPFRWNTYYGFDLHDWTLRDTMLGNRSSRVKCWFAATVLQNHFHPMPICKNYQNFFSSGRNENIYSPVSPQVDLNPQLPKLSSKSSEILILFLSHNFDPGPPLRWHHTDSGWWTTIGKFFRCLTKTHASQKVGKGKP